MTAPNIQVAHQIPGRIRLKVPSVKENPGLIEQIKQTFNAVPGIEEVTVNPSTGSVILYYDTDRHDEFHDRLEHHTGGHDRPPADDIDVLADKIEQEAEYLAEHSHSAKVVVDFFKDLDRQIKVASGNLIDLKVVLAVAIAGFTIFEVGATAATPVWVTLAVFALNHIIVANAIQTNAADADRPDDEEALAVA